VKVQARHLVFAAPMSHRELLVREISSQLLDAGIRAYPPEFPYGVHHEYYRTRLRHGGRHSKLSDIARALESWAATRENDDDYVWQAVCGFLLSYFSERPEHRERLPSEIGGRIGILRWGEDFLEYSRSAISPPA
jgi:hypothetical protein